MDLKNSKEKLEKLGKIVDKGLAFTHLKKNGNGVGKKKEILSDEEISNICASSQFADMFVNVVENIGLDLLMHVGLINESLVDRLCGEDRRRKYVCSIYAGKTSAASAFESYLRGDQSSDKSISEDNIERFGMYGFWHYFVECKTGRLNSLREGAMMYSREKVADVVKENQSTSCSMASSFRQIRWKN